MSQLHLKIFSKSAEGEVNTARLNLQTLTKKTIDCLFREVMKSLIVIQILTFGK